MIRVFIVDDHPVVIEGIHSLLKNEKDIAWVGQAMNAQSCIGFFVNNTADVVLMDISMPGMDGIELCAVMKEKYPGIFILGLSTFNQGAYIKKMMENGASGYVLKNSSKEELIKAIHAVYGGDIFFSGEVGQVLAEYQKSSKSELPLLTSREKEVLELIAEGYTNPQIAEKIFLSQFTVDSHRKNLLAKLNVKNTASLIKFAVENKLIWEMGEGYTNPQIAEKLFVSPFTVDSHRKNLIAKLNVKNTAMLIRFAVENKLI